MNYSVGIDIGGTNITIGVVEETGEIIAQQLIPTDLTVPSQEMVERIIGCIKQVILHSKIADEAIVGIGIGAPGPIDSAQGLIVNPPHMKTWTNTPIVQLIQQAFDMPVLLENDASVAALAEKWIGAARDSDDFAYMTISTGIGAGILSDGRLLRGLRGNAGEIGHTVVDPSFGQCSCGQYGCLESIASGTSIARRGSRIAGRELTTEEVFELYEEGHEEIVAYIDRVFYVIGVACVSIINTFDTEKIVIGGGVSKVGKPLFSAVQAYVSRYALDPASRSTPVIPAQLEDQVGVIGAASLWFLDYRSPGEFHGWMANTENRVQK